MPRSMRRLSTKLVTASDLAALSALQAWPGLSVAGNAYRESATTCIAGGLRKAPKRAEKLSGKALAAGAGRGSRRCWAGKE